MKNQLYKFIGICAVSLLLPSLAAAQPATLVVDFENTPLFAEANFLPGNEITRFAKVTNNTGALQTLLVKAVNVTYPEGFGSS